jgi:signal transduction histidine kinase
MQPQPSSHASDFDPYAGDMLELLFDRIPMGIVVIDPDFTILRDNATWESFCQRNSPETAQILCPGAHYFQLLPLSHPTFEPLFKRALNGETLREFALYIPTSAASPYCNILIAPLIHNEHITGILVAGTDVTEQVETHLALQTALNELRLSHEAVEQRVDERTRELKTLMTVQQALTSSLNHDEVLHVIAREARRLTHTQVGAVFLPQHDSLLLAALSCEYPVDIEVGYSISLTDSITGTAFRTGQTQLVTDISSHPGVDPNATNKAGLHSILSVPLISGSCIIGVLSVGNKIDGVLGAEDERLLNMMVPSAVIALENVRVYEQASETAVAAERGRLARDLHDSVTQTLFSASLTAEVLPRIWSRDPAEGMIRLEKLRELTRGALAEMRTLLLELRPTALTEMPLVALLRQLAEGIAGRTRIAIRMSVEGDVDPAADVKIALYRIAQEALNNIAKHAKTKTAEVILRQTDQAITLIIRDNGRGFDPTANRANHLGLRIMVERAEAINAEIKIEAAPNRGTTVKVLWCEQE